MWCLGLFDVLVCALALLGLGCCGSCCEMFVVGFRLSVLFITFCGDFDFLSSGFGVFGLV